MWLDGFICAYPVQELLSSRNFAFLDFIKLENSVQPFVFHLFHPSPTLLRNCVSGCTQIRTVDIVVQETNFGFPHYLPFLVFLPLWISLGQFLLFLLQVYSSFVHLCLFFFFFFRYCTFYIQKFYSCFICLHIVAIISFKSLKVLKLAILTVFANSVISFMSAYVSVDFFHMSRSSFSMSKNVFLWMPDIVESCC